MDLEYKTFRIKNYLIIKESTSRTNSKVLVNLRVQIIIIRELLEIIKLMVMDSSVQTSSSMRVNLNKGRNKGEGLSK